MVAGVHVCFLLETYCPISVVRIAVFLYEAYKPFCHIHYIKWQVQQFAHLP